MACVVKAPGALTLAAGDWVEAQDGGDDAESIAARDFHTGTLSDLWKTLASGDAVPARPAPLAAALWRAARDEWRPEASA